MSVLTAKIHLIQLRLGLRPRPCWESLQRSPDPLAGFKGSTSKRERKGWSGRRGGICFTFFYGFTPVITRFVLPPYFFGIDIFVLTLTVFIGRLEQFSLNLVS